MSSATDANAVALRELLRSHRPVTLLVGDGLATAIGVARRETVDTADPAERWAHWRPHMQRIFDTVPGDQHFRLRRWAEELQVVSVLTDSEDWLVSESGVETVELTRSVAQSFCPDCGYSEPLGCLLSMPPIPVCAACGAILEPGPMVAPAQADIQAARDALAASELLLVLGSTMTDATVSTLVAEFLDGGGRLAVANDGATRFDAQAIWRSDDLIGTIADLD